MTEITDFYFNMLNLLWQSIITNWILSVGVLFTLIGWVISLIVGSRQQ